MEQADDPAAFVGFAERLADAARAETLERWRQGCAAEGKSGAADFDPVTDADREGERAIRAAIEAEFPDHSITGEEFPDRIGSSRWSWSLDPVDGTRSFICRLPTWTTLIALLDRGRPVLGVIDAPCLDERYIGWGGEAWLVSRGERTRMTASGCEALREARLSTTDPYMLGGHDGFERLRRGARTTRYGHDAYGYARLAAGSIDLVVEIGLRPHDYNALIPLVRAAGGTIGDWRGGKDFTDGDIIAAASPALYETAVVMMKS